MAASVEQVTYNNDDGATMGKGITEKISFYGISPVDQYPSVPAASTYITVGQSSASASTYGLNSAAAMADMVLAVSSMAAALKRCGLVA